MDVMRPILERAPPRIGEGIAGKVAQSGESVLTATIDPASLLRPHVDPSVVRWLPKSLVTVALKVSGRIIGTMSVCRRELPAFTLQDMRLVEEIADRAAAAIDRSRLHDEGARARVRAEVVSRVAGAANRALRLEDVFDASLDAMCELGAERSSILSFDAAGVMRFRAWRELSDSYRAAVDGHSPWSRSSTTFEPIVVADALNDPAWSAYAEVFRAESIAALAFVPLVNGGELVGKFMLYWGAPRELRAEEMETVTAVASHVAAAIARFQIVDELQETVRFNETFSGILGHDLRNPLSAMMTGAHLVMRVGGEPVQKPVARILSSGERMSRMIDQLLDFTRVRLGGGIPLRGERTDLVALARRILDEHSSPAQMDRLELSHEGHTEGPWDEDRLGQVFSNLVGNAIEHGRAGEPVRVCIVGESDGVRIEIENAGAIPTDVLPKLFEPLAGSPKSRPGSRGLGLGLFITRQIIEAHGGTIRVSSTEEHGTRFSIRLPRTGPQRDP